MFSVGAQDNIDHNTSATTAMPSFHGTGVIVFQFPTEDNPGVSRQPNKGLDSQLDTLSLPGSYSIVPPIELKTTSIKVPPRNQQPIESSLVENMERENLWIKCASASNQQSTTRAAYHSNSHPNNKLKPPAITALLPLFYEKAATAAMIKHGMNVLKQTIHMLNPNQVLVITLDQPLFAIAKIIQWKWPETHGEDKYVVNQLRKIVLEWVSHVAFSSCQTIDMTLECAPRYSSFFVMTLLGDFLRIHIKVIIIFELTSS